MDSDEEEMASMRTSSRYAPAPRRPAATPTGKDGSDDDERPASTSRAPASLTRPQSAAQRDGASDDEDGDYVAEEASSMMMEFMPMSFGKKKEVKTTSGIEIHQGNARKTGPTTQRTGVQFGHRVADAARAVGAKQRADRAEEEAKLAQANSVSREAVRETVRPDIDDAESDVELPPPGKEQDALPLSHEVGIPAHEKLVTAISLDPKGARMATGSMDGAVKLFDFNGMSEEKSCFRIVEPVEGHMVQGLSFSPTGGCILVVCSDSHARIYDRDGSAKPIQSTVKGDMYVRDMQHTKGHTQMLTSGVWHPFAAENWITSSIDGTIRIWDINATPVGMDQVLPSVHVLKTLDKRNVCVGGAAGRNGGLYPGCCAYSPGDAKMIAGGCSDGSVQVFFEKARYMRPDRILRNAHNAAVTDVTFLKQGANSNLLVTRSLDDSMKVWDCRMLSDAKGPLKTFYDLPCGHEKTGICTSPDGRYLVAGTAHRKGSAASATVRLYDVRDWSVAKTLDFGKRTPVRCSWPQELNQLIVGTSTGEVTMLYSPFSSKKGALHFVGRRAKKQASNELAYAGEGPIFNMTDAADIQKFYSTGHGNMTRIRKAEARHNQKTLTPIRPQSKETSQAASSDTASFAAAVVKAGAQQLRLQNASGQEKDSQKALLAYADRIESAKPQDRLIGRAYTKTQPENLLDWSVDQSEGDKRMSQTLSGEFCRKCGQKVCRCMDYSQWGTKRQKTG